MSTLAGDFWVCGDCRSINNAGARQCYNCRTPRDRAAVDPDTIDPSSHGPLRTIELPPFHASRWAAALASILILAVGVMSIVQFNLWRQLADYVARGIATSEDYAYVGSFNIVAIGIVLLALIAWALWLSRTVTSMPALGLGYPAANGMMAFVENFIPILNLWRVPAIVRDVARRLEPKTGGDETMTRGEALVFAAWISVFGGYLVPRVLSLFTGDTEALITITGIGVGLSVVGAIFLVVLIWWVEGKVLERRRFQLAGAATQVETSPAPVAGVDEVAAEPMPEAVIAATALDAARDRSALAAFATAGSRSTDSFRLPATEEPPLMPAAAIVARPPSETEPHVDSVDESEAVATAGSDPPPATELAEESTLTPTVPPPVEEAAPTEEVAAAAHISTVPGAGPAVQSPPPTDPAAAPTDPAPARVEPPPPTPAPIAGPPDLTIRVSSRGMMTAELDGELEHVMLDDLGSYAEALSHVGGTATIHVPTDEGMPALIGKRAQRILEDAGVRVTLA